MQVHCTQCGAAVEAQEGESYLRCPYCDSALYLDKRRVVFHYVLKRTLDRAQAEAALRRFMASNDKPKHLDRDAKVTKAEAYYFPLWQFKVKAAGKEQVYLQPAASTSVSELKKLQVPAGDLEFFDEAKHKVEEMRAPEVLLDAAALWLKGVGVDPASVAEAFLCHVPVFEFHYAYQGKPFVAVVEGSSGAAFANIFPTKSEAPYLLVASAVVAAFLLEGCILGGAGGPLLGALCIGVTMAPAFFACWQVARRV